MNTFFKTFIDQPFSGKNRGLFFTPMLYSLFYFLQVYLSDFSSEKTVFIFACYAVYIALYTAIFLDYKRAPWYILATLGLTIWVSSVLVSSNALLWSSAFFCGYLYLRKTAIFMLAACCLAALIASRALPYGDVNLYLAIAILPMLFNWFFGALIQHFKREDLIKKEKDQQIESLAKIAERERIARDMHDLLGHSLTCIALKSELAGKHISKQNWQQAKDEIDEVATLSRSALHDVRAAIGNYKKCSFIEQTNKLITQLHSAGLQVEHTIPEISMSAETEAALTLVATEATTNILRHSKASKACFTLKKQKNQLHFTISDNGQANNITEGHGLKGIRERINKLGGDISLTTHNGLSMEIIINERVTG